ncbi:MAG: dockerin type I repeat-containing protein [Oscillospiraceae bacterium]|nr:dockerin type I repeat-containing protein [Oscillospiraceae bacterium]
MYGSIYAEAIGAVAGTKIEGPAEIKFTIGDVNCDGKINIFDVCEMKNGLKSGFSSNVYALASDVDQSDDVTIADAVQLHKYVDRKWCSSHLALCKRRISWR